MTTVVYTVAAEGAGELQGNSIRAANREPKRVPAGTSHAVALDSDTTACGVDVSGLELFPETVFDQASMLHRCRDCQQSISST
jgi:hypothetical protein